MKSICFKFVVWLCSGACAFSIALAEEETDMAALLAKFNRLYATKQFSKAAPVAEKILQIREESQGPESRGTAAAANNLAEVYRYMGQYAKAEPLYQRALKVFEKELGHEHPDVASVLSNIALLYSETGDYAKAEPIYQRVLKIREAAFGPDNPQTAESLNALAALYYYMGQYAKAEPLYQRALKIREKRSEERRVGKECRRRWTTLTENRSVSHGELRRTR